MLRMWPSRMRRADQRGGDRLGHREAGPAAAAVEAQAVALQPQLAVVHDQQRGAALAGHVGVDVQRQLQRRPGRQRRRRAAGRHDARLGQHRQPVERAERGVALRLAPEQQVAVGRQRGQQAARFLVEAEPAGARRPRRARPAGRGRSRGAWPLASHALVVDGQPAVVERGIALPGIGRAEDHLQRVVGLRPDVDRHPGAGLAAGDAAGAAVGARDLDADVGGGAERRIPGLVEARRRCDRLVGRIGIRGE